MRNEPKGQDDGRIHLAFDRDFLTIPVAAIVPLKVLPDGARASRSYSQVLSSIKAIGLIEAPVVMADTKNAGTWFLLDGHLRVEALKELGIDADKRIIEMPEEVKELGSYTATVKFHPEVHQDVAFDVVAEEA